MKGPAVARTSYCGRVLVLALALGLTASCSGSGSGSGPASTSGSASTSGPGSGSASTSGSTTTVTAPTGAGTAAPGGSGSPPSSSPPNSSAATAAADWPTYFHDAGRSGATSGGPAVAASVHRLWTSPSLDGDVYAQPLVVGNTVITATENDTVYALSAASGAVLWSRHLGSPVPGSALPCGNVDPVGITSTPVADLAAGRVYVVSLVQPIRDILFELDLTSGAIVASTTVDAPGADPTTHNQRGALGLSGGAVLVPFGGRYGDCGDYHGRLSAVPVAGAGLGTPRWYTLPSGREGGFWAPPGPVVDGDGSILLTSGNSAGNASYDYGNSVVRLTSDLKLIDSFAPANWAALNGTDGDLGSTNPVLITPNRVFQTGKSGVGYLLNSGHLGGIGGELAQGQVCNGEAIGGVSHSGTTAFVPCPGGVAAVSLAGDRVSVRWRSTTPAPGPAIVTPGAVWTVATGSGSGALMAVDPSTGRQLFSESIGPVPSRFTSPAAGLGRIVAAAGRKLVAFGD